MDSRTDTRSAWAVYAALLFGTFITIEAAAFQAPALPSVTRHFGIPVNMSALILILYSLALTVFAPIMGRLGDQYGRKRVITIGMLVFAVSEFAAAWAPNFGFFLGARFVQGLGAACILPGVFAYAAHLFPDNKRGLALGILAFTMTFGAASGGLLGGLLIDRLGWPSVYWISGALTLVGLVPVRMLVPEIAPAKHQAAFDYTGAMLLFAVIASLLSLPTWATNFGKESPITWAIVVVGISALVVLWRHSKRAPNPVIDLGILSRGAFATPSAIYWLHMIFSSGVVYSLAFFINSRPGGTAAQFGFVTLFLYGSGLISSPIAGKLVDRIEPRVLVIIAMLASLGGTLLFLNIDVTTPLWMVIAVACIMGLSIGCNTPAIMKLALGAVPAKNMGAGSGLFSMFRDLGSPTGSSLSLAVFGASLAYATQDAIMRQTAALGLDTASLEALARATGSRARELPAEVATRLGEAGLSANTVLAEANIAGLNTALTNVGYMLLGLIGLALVLSLRLKRTRAAAVTGDAQARVS
ncbi:arabinose efflux permease family protein [Thauera sp. 28]|uniref:MFS transporter n=1 Tax=Thauera sp. 28 TaxID=303682 RepID=UPI0002CFFFDA|nr:MFS transporter [Thauera sp. 28]ENO94147.1 arabinose efflux permease family protein [Thauera sp. 28]